MHRLALLLWFLFIPAQTQADALWTQQDVDDYEAMTWPTSCENPKNADRWGVREPTEEELAVYGPGILVFQYLNNEASCSNATEGLGIWYQGTRMLMLQVETLGREFDSHERITVSPVPESTHILLKPGGVLLEDSDEFQTWILLKPLS
jgi:hypothetical protein